MKSLLTWMVALGVLAGFCGHSIAEDPCEVILAMHAREHSGHHHDPAQPCDPSHDRECPVEHHQQGHCGHSMPLAAEVHAPARPGVFGYSLMPVRHEAEVPPDGPCAELDKPPLI